MANPGATTNRAVLPSAPVRQKRIIIIGGNGLIGAPLVNALRRGGHDVGSVSYGPDVNGCVEERLTRALVGADVVVDVANPPSFAAPAVLGFHVALSRNLVAAAAAAGVQHHVALSMVGVSPIQAGGYFRAKAVQERLITGSATPYTIVRSTQSLEFLDRSLKLAASSGAVIRLPIAMVQPIAADDLASALAAAATAPPMNRTVEVAGPDPIYLHELARLILSGHEDPRRIIASANAHYLGALLGEWSLMPGADSLVGPTTLRNWLRQLIPAG